MAPGLGQHKAGKAQVTNFNPPAIDDTPALYCNKPWATPTCPLSCPQGNYNLVREARPQTQEKLDNKIFKQQFTVRHRQLLNEL